MDNIDKLIENTESVMSVLAKDIKIGCQPKLYEAYAELASILKDLYILKNNK